MLPPSVRIYVARNPIDCRKSYDGLSAVVRSEFGADPLSGHLFVFLNRRADQVQMLFFDRTGYCILKKRLERGTFRLGKNLAADATHAEVDAAELALMLEGIDLTEAKRRPRWHAKVRDATESEPR